MNVDFIDIELKKLIESGKSRKFKRLAAKPAILKNLIYIYTIISTLIDSIEELGFYTSVKPTIGEDGTIIIPVDSASKIHLILLLQGEVISILPLQITENYE